MAPDAHGKFAHRSGGTCRWPRARRSAWSSVEGVLACPRHTPYDRAVAVIDINLAVASVLVHQYCGQPPPQVNLARRIATGRDRMDARIDSLETKNAVRGEADLIARRVWLATLTPAGRARWECSANIDRTLRHQLRAGTTPSERMQLDDLLLRIQRNVAPLITDES